MRNSLLSSIPPAVFYDGEQYLIQKYGIALAPSLQLIDPQPLKQAKIDVLLAGISASVQNLSALPGVEIELNNIQKEIGPETVLLNNNFTEVSFTSEIKKTPYQIVHLATHGEFGNNPENTWILAFDDKINVNELSNLLHSDEKTRATIELLVLRACKTAVGDDRAVLGLAGVAVKAGARSTLASSWYMSDEATTVLMSNFYRELAQGNLNKSEAFRRAQLAIITNEKYSHPYFWSAFVLVGNWL